MNAKEQTRLQVLNSLLAEHMTLDQAATLMGVSPRHTRRILADYRENGAASLAHGLRGCKPANATPEPVATAVVHLAAHQVRRDQPHLSQRVAERARRHRHRQDHAAAHPGQRRAQQSAAQATAQAPGVLAADAPGGHADPDGWQLPPIETRLARSDCAFSAPGGKRPRQPGENRGLKSHSEGADFGRSPPRSVSALLTAQFPGDRRLSGSASVSPGWGG